METADWVPGSTSVVAIGPRVTLPGARPVTRVFIKSLNHTVPEAPPPLMATSL